MSPPRIPLVFRVGVTGHRWDVEPPRVRALVGEILAQHVQEALSSIARIPDSGYDGQSARLMVISPLAEGADQLVAEEAAQLGFELHCPIPFEVEEYRRDFRTPQSEEKFKSLLNTATAVMQLDGRREQEKLAYEMVGRVVLNHSDLLIAIWDGAPPELRGGTAQIVEEAQRVGIPVIWINPNDPQEAKVLIGFREDGLSLKDLGDYLRAQLVISDSRQARQLETYFSETRDRSPRTGLFTLFCHVVNLKVPNLQLKSSNHLERVKGRWRDSWIVPSGAVADPVVMGIISKLEEGVLPSYAWADNLANYYGAVFRSSFLFTYLLSPVAVLMALLSVLDKSSHRMVWAEMAIIFVIGAVTLWAAKRHWHQRWLEYRLLAEYLRQFRFLWLLGQKSPSSELPAHYGDDDPRNTWVAWLVHAVERNAGLADAQLCDDYLRKVKTILTTEVNTQIDYHEKKSHDYHVVHHRLHQIGFTLFFLTFLACIMHLVPRIVPIEAYYLTAVSAFFPALGAGLAGILSQGEFHRVAMRSEQMAARLKEIRTRLTGPLNISREVLGQVAEEVARTMLAELVDWRVVFLRKPLELPG